MTTQAGPADGGPPLFGPQMLADPYPTYHRLRSVHPAAWSPQLDAWVVTGYEAVSSALRDPRVSSDRLGRARQRLASRGLEAVIDERARSMIHRDPPDHTRLRALVNKAFTPRAVDAMEGRIRAIVDELLDAVAGRGRFDILSDLAYPLPVMVIAEMLGVPAADRDRFKHWSDDVAILLGGDLAGLPEPVLRRAVAARAELADYFGAAVARCRREPGDDLLTALVRAEEAGGRLSEDELYSTAILLLIAGNETTTNLIGNGLLALLRHPDEMRRLWADEALLPGAVEEMLRYDSPVQMTTRLARADLQLHGTTVPAGQWLYLVLGAANRDPAQFPDPDRFDIGRADNKHVSFGAGPHFCLGAPLARLEARLALGALRRRFPNLRLAADAVEHRDNFNLRGLKALPVTC
jgi:cytochrome P450